VIFEAVPGESVDLEKPESGITQWLVQSDKEGLAYPVGTSVGIPWIGIHSVGSKRTKAHTQGSSKHVAVYAKPSYETGSFFPPWWRGLLAQDQNERPCHLIVGPDASAWRRVHKRSQQDHAVYPSVEPDS
jgi:hypothetical protein